jgi:hypothetical protein
VLGGSLVILLNRGLVDLDVLGLDDADNLQLVSNSGRAKHAWFASSYPLLELGQIGGAESISLGNDRDQVDS